MAKLVVLNAALAGRSHELNVEKTTIGRVEDNSFQIAEPSVSSHHCEIYVHGSEVVVKDLNSTNGTFINGEKIIEAVLKPGQVLRLGQIEIRLENGAGTPASAPSASAPAPAPAPVAGAMKKPLDQTVVVRGVSLNELEQGPRTSGLDTASKAFTKKTNKTNRWFIIAGIVAAVAILIGLLIAFHAVNH
jgi:pSer/pThr/pTyr-binding forkhead associated (FHA) protein